MGNLPDRIATSPLTLACPVCHVQPGEVCELCFGEDETTHVERIWAAVRTDNTEQDRLSRLRIAVQRWNVYPISVPGGEKTKAPQTLSSHGALMRGYLEREDYLSYGSGFHHRTVAMGSEISKM